MKSYHKRMNITNLKLIQHHEFNSGCLIFDNDTPEYGFVITIIEKTSYVKAKRLARDVPVIYLGSGSGYNNDNVTWIVLLSATGIEWWDVRLLARYYHVLS